MQKEKCDCVATYSDELDEELIDTLIAISVVSKRIANKIRKIKDKGGTEDGPQE